MSRFMRVLYDFFSLHCERFLFFGFAVVCCWGGERRTKCVFVSVLRTSERDTHRQRGMGVWGGGRKGEREREERGGEGDSGTASRWFRL